MAKSTGRVSNSLLALRRLAKTEMDDAEDQDWLLDLLVNAYRRGHSDGRQATVHELHALLAYAEKARLYEADIVAQGQEKFEALPPEEQQKLRLEARAKRKAQTAVKKDIAAGKEILQREALERRKELESET